MDNIRRNNVHLLKTPSGVTHEICVGTSTLLCNDAKNVRNKALIGQAPINEAPINNRSTKTVTKKLTNHSVTFTRLPEPKSRKRSLSKKSENYDHPSTFVISNSVHKKSDAQDHIITESNNEDLSYEQGTLYTDQYNSHESFPGSVEYSYEPEHENADFKSYLRSNQQNYDGEPLYSHGTHSFSLYPRNQTSDQSYSNLQEVKVHNRFGQSFEESNSENYVGFQNEMFESVDPSEWSDQIYSVPPSSQHTTMDETTNIPLHDTNHSQNLSKSDLTDSLPAPSVKYLDENDPNETTSASKADLKSKKVKLNADCGSNYIEDIQQRVNMDIFNRIIGQTKDPSVLLKCIKALIEIRQVIPKPGAGKLLVPDKIFVYKALRDILEFLHDNYSSQNQYQHLSVKDLNLPVNLCSDSPSMMNTREEFVQETALKLIRFLKGDEDLSALDDIDLEFDESVDNIPAGSRWVYQLNDSDLTVDPATVLSSEADELHAVVEPDFDLIFDDT